MLKNDVLKKDCRFVPANWLVVPNPRLNPWLNGVEVKYFILLCVACHSGYCIKIEKLFISKETDIMEMNGKYWK